MFRSRNDAALDSADPFRNGATIKFYWHVELNDIYPIDGAVVVGKTKYSHGQLCKIGIGRLSSIMLELPDLRRLLS
jgi:hypothetical protein